MTIEEIEKASKLLDLKTQFTSNLLKISKYKDELEKIKLDIFILNPRVKELTKEISELKKENYELDIKIKELEEETDGRESDQSDK